MADNRRRGSENNEPDDNSVDLGSILGIGAAAITGLGLAYWATRSSNTETRNVLRAQSFAAAHDSDDDEDDTVPSSRTLHRHFRRAVTLAEGPVYQGNYDLPIVYHGNSSIVLESCHNIQGPQNIKHLNTLLEVIYNKYIALKQNEFDHNFKVVKTIVDKMHQTMKEVDRYYGQYSSKVQYVGSFPDKLRVSKPDEFDVNIIISLPVNMEVDKFKADESDIIIEPKTPGFVQLKVGKQFLKLPYKPNWEVNQIAYLWKDEKDYIQRTEFSFWFQKVIDKALDNHKKPSEIFSSFIVDGNEYSVRRFHNGPAFTLGLLSKDDPRFKIDVDLVPAIRFSERRWLSNYCRGYRDISSYSAGEPYWSVVPKLDRLGQNKYDEARSWRISVYDQEQKVFHNLYNAKKAIRLMKKMRDVQDMNKIASYYIKTIYYWETLERDQGYWKNNSFVVIFKDMIIKFRNCLISGNIKYFWHSNNNLIHGVKEELLKQYVRTLDELIRIFNNPTVFTQKNVADFFLTDSEIEDFTESFWPDINNTRLTDN